MKQIVKFSSESTLAQQCFEQLQDDIIHGILKPGEKLKVGPITQRFSIGQSPVREALSRLASFGLVDVETNKGFRVSAISEADIRDTYNTFTQIENMALAMAIEKGDDSWESSIVAALHTLGRIETQVTAHPYTMWAERNYNFHVALIAACNSPTLLKIRQYVYIKFDRYCKIAYQLSSHPLSLNHEEHTQLAQTVLARDTKRAQALMTYHINGAIETVIDTVKKNNLI
jgi:GntR family transcriptional regulator, carbon starvation induced regulator